jgi:hypothetical protein
MGTHQEHCKGLRSVINKFNVPARAHGSWLLAKTLSRFVITLLGGQAVSLPADHHT